MLSLREPLDTSVSTRQPQAGGDWGERADTNDNALLSVLVVDHLEEDALLIANHIRSAGYRVAWERVETARAMEAALTRAPWDVIIADWRMPGFTALAALALLQGHEQWIPFVIVSSEHTADQAASAMRAGARDCVTKSELTRLVPVIEREVAETQRRREKESTDADLKTMEAINQLTTECAPVGIMHTSIKTGKWIAVNTTLASMLGYSKQELVGGSFSEFTHPDDREESSRLMERLVKGELSDIRFEKRYLRKDGSVMWARLIVTRVDRSQVEPFLLAFVEDISDRVMADRERADLLLREQQLRAEAEKTAEMLVRLRALTRRLSTALTPEDVGQVAVDDGARALGARSAAIVTVAAATGRLSLLSTFGPVTNTRRKLAAFCQDASMPVARALHSGEAIWLASREEAEAAFPGIGEYFDSCCGGADGKGAIVTMGLMASDSIIGAVVYMFKGNNQFEDDTRSLAATIAMQSAEALGRARAYEQASLSWAAAEEARSTLQRAMDQAPSGMFTVDTTGRITHANAKARGMWGRSVRRLPLGAQTHPFLASLSTDDPPLTCDQMPVARVLRGEMAQPIELRYRSPLTGESVWERTSAAPLLNHENIIGAVVTIEDITVHRRMMEAIEESEMRYRTLVETAHDGIVVVNAQGVVTFANRRLASLLGLESPQDLVGNSITDVITVNSVEPAAANVWKDLQQGASINAVAVLRRSDGTELFAEMNGSRLPARDGDPPLFMALLRDVTDRRRTEESLRQSEERYRSLVETSPDGISLLGTDGTILMANQVAAEQRGVGDPADLVGHNILEFGHIDQRHRMAHFSRVVAGKDGGALEIVYGELGVSERPVEIRSSLLLDEHGKPEAVLSTSRDIRERKEMEERLRWQATHDSLTGLANRDGLSRTLAECMTDRPLDQPLAVILVDLDRFKEINDAFGHPLGDSILQEVARRVTKSVPAADVVSRLGGDEFVVVLAHGGRRDALTAARCILEAFEMPIVMEGQRFDIDPSIGLAVFPYHGSDADALLRHADVAMYKAKAGQSGCCFYSAALDVNTPERLALMSELHEALEDGGLVVYYQPKASLRTGEIESVEALVRWPHPTLGLMAPDQFIPLAEHTGLITPLTNAVLDAAIRQAAAWQQVSENLVVAVNLSAYTLHDSKLLARIQTLLKAYAVPPQLLKVELTETAIASDSRAATCTLAGLADAGIHVAIDDFGVGYTSLSRLTEPYVDEIKIDRSFVQSMLVDRSSAFIVRSTIDLGHSLGLKVVAEGVEDVRTWDLLTVLGCDLAQGYYISPPVPASDLTPKLGNIISNDPVGLHVVAVQA
jgi:diguanylate cyclase (GGDEF)-like protein/PAS domain S-box-containing protein